MAYISCPCGFRAETGDEYEDLGDAMAAFKAHGCAHHPSVVQDTNGWAVPVMLGILAATVVLVCIICASVRRF